MKTHAQKTNRPAEKLSTLATRKNAAPCTASAFAQETEALDETSTRHDAPRGHDFSQIPVFSKTPIRLQTKLMVNAPGDIYELEADRMAEQVMRTPESDGSDSGHHPIHTKILPTTDSAKIEAPPIVDEVLRSPGQPLDSSTRAFMARRLGHDFSHVRIHHDAKADDAARKMAALAFTSGRDLFFRFNCYKPRTREGQGLLAHELTHTVQQQSATQAQAIQMQHDQKADDPPWFLRATQNKADKVFVSQKVKSTGTYVDPLTTLFNFLEYLGRFGLSVYGSASSGGSDFGRKPPKNFIQGPSVDLEKLQELWALCLLGTDIAMPTSHREAFYQAKEKFNKWEELVKNPLEIGKLAMDAKDEIEEIRKLQQEETNERDLEKGSADNEKVSSGERRIKEQTTTDVPTTNKPFVFTVSGRQTKSIEINRYRAYMTSTDGSGTFFFDQIGGSQTFKITTDPSGQLYVTSPEDVGPDFYRNGWTYIYRGNPKLRHLLPDYE